MVAQTAGDVSSLTLALVAAGAALAGVLVQTVSGWLGGTIADRRSHREWVRERRLEAYTAFLDSLSEFLKQTERQGRDDFLHTEVVPKYNYALFCASLKTRNQILQPFMRELTQVLDSEPSDDLYYPWLSTAISTMGEHMSYQLGFNQYDQPTPIWRRLGYWLRRRLQRRA